MQEYKREYRITIKDKGTKIVKGATPREAFNNAFPDLQILACDKTSMHIANVCIELLDGVRASKTYYICGKKDEQARVKRVYLVQSGKFRLNANPEKNALDKYINWTYMGAAEFEIGSDSEFPNTNNPLCIALKRMTKYEKEYEFFTIDSIKEYTTHPLVVYCRKEDIVTLVPIIKKMAQNKHQTKRGTGFYAHITYAPTDKFYSDTNFWFDIENDFFMFFGEDKKDIIKDSFMYYKSKWYEELFPPQKKTSFFGRLFGSKKK